MEIVKEVKQGIHVMKISGRMDANTAPEAEKVLMSVISEGAKKVILDLGNLTYISSAGLRVLLIIAKELRIKGGKIVLCSMIGIVKKVFDISGFSSILVIKTNENEALQSF